MTPSVVGHTIYHNTVQEAIVSFLPFLYIDWISIVAYVWEVIIMISE